MTEAVFQADGEDSSRYHRQGWPGDHHRKLSRQTSVYLTEFLAPQLTFFGYAGRVFGLRERNHLTAAGAPAASESANFASLKRLVHELQRENAYSIDEIAGLRRNVASLLQLEVAAA